MYSFGIDGAKAAMNQTSITAWQAKSKLLSFIL